MLVGTVENSSSAERAATTLPPSPPESPASAVTTAAVHSSSPPTPSPSPLNVRLEKNLASLGFFSPSSKRTYTARAKRVTLTRAAAEGGGAQVEATATILPAALYGLPVTSDQDKYLALQAIVAGVRRRGDGVVRNPVSFTSTQMLDLLGAGTGGGKNFREVAEWLDLMVATTIVSEEAVYLAGRRKYARDRFKVFERAVSVGQALDDGRVAERNYVWFSEWQLENINGNHVVPVDFDSYRRLKNHIAKTLVPLLQIWLYASRGEGRFEKRYDEVCQILDVRRYGHRSKIVEKLGPSLDELREHGYLAGWEVARTADGVGYKIVFHHGWRHQQRRRSETTNSGSGSDGGHPRSQRRGRQDDGGGGGHGGADRNDVSLGCDTAGDPIDDAPCAPAPGHAAAGTTETPGGGGESGAADAGLLAALMAQGIAEEKARQLIAKAAVARQSIAAQLTWGEHLLRESEPGRYRNPAGFLIHLIETNAAVPAHFGARTGAAANPDANAVSGGGAVRHPPECRGCFGSGMEVVAGKGARRCTLALSGEAPAAGKSSE